MSGTFGLDGGQTTINNTLHIMDGAQRIGTERVGTAFPEDSSPAVQYHLSEPHGTSNLVVDESGSWCNREEYSPFGETVFGGFARKRYRYTGQERDEESGLGYHSARYYASWLCRWTRPDPAGLVDGGNLYLYVRGSPIRGRDPGGMDWEDSGPSISAHEPSLSESAERFGRDFHRGTIDAGLEWIKGVERSIEVAKEFASDLSSDPGQTLTVLGNDALDVAGNVWEAAKHPIDTPVAIVSAVVEPYSREIEAGHPGAALGRLVTEGAANAAGAILGVGPAAAAGRAARKVPGRLPDVGSAEKLPKDKPAVGSGGGGGSELLTSQRKGPLVETEKWNYLFGRAAGAKNAAHNAPRTAQNLQQMRRLGVPDNEAGRAMLQSHLDEVVQDPSSVVRTWTTKFGSFEARESLFSGPGGFAKFETSFELMDDGTRRLTSIIPRGGP